MKGINSKIQESRTDNNALPVATLSIKKSKIFGGVARHFIALFSVIIMLIIVACFGTFGGQYAAINGVYADENNVSESVYESDDESADESTDESDEDGADEAALRRTALSSSWQFVDKIPELKNLPEGAVVSYAVHDADGDTIEKSDIVVDEKYSVTATLSADSARSYYFSETGTDAVSLFFVYSNDTLTISNDPLEDIFPFWSLLISALALLGFIIALIKIISDLRANSKEKKEQKKNTNTYSFAGVALLAFLGLDVKAWMILAFATVALFFIGVILMLITWKHRAHHMVEQAATPSTNIYVNNSYQYLSGFVEEDDELEEELEEELVGEKRRRNPSNFRVKLKASSDKCKDFYVQLKNFISGYRNVTFRMSGTVEKVIYRGELLAYIGATKRSLKLFLALNPKDFDAEVYHHKDVSDKKRYELVPMLVRVSSGRALTRAKGLIETLATKHVIETKVRHTDRNLQLMAYTLGRNALVKDKRAELLTFSIHVHDADVLSNADADRFTETRNSEEVEERNFASVSLDTLDEKFLDGQRVTLNKLKKKGLVPEECNSLRVTAGTRLSKPLCVVADDYSFAAVKMIVLTGGRAIKLIPSPKPTTE